METCLLMFLKQLPEHISLIITRSYSIQQLAFCGPVTVLVVPAVTSSSQPPNLRARKLWLCFPLPLPLRTPRSVPRARPASMLMREELSSHDLSVPRRAPPSADATTARRRRVCRRLGRTSRTSRSRSNGDSHGSMGRPFFKLVAI